MRSYWEKCNENGNLNAGPNGTRKQLRSVKERNEKEDHSPRVNFSTKWSDE